MVDLLLDVAAWFAARPQLPQLLLVAAGLGLMAVRTRRSQPISSTRGQANQRTIHAPGFVARWRARRGVRHPRRGVAVGYQSAGELVTFSARELNHHGVVFGAPGSGKTTLISLLVQGHARLGPVIAVDGKGSAVLREAVRSAGGLVWTIGGQLKLDLLDADPTVLADQIGEVARVAGGAEVYHEAGARAIQWAGHVLGWRHQAPTLVAIEELLRPGHLAKALADFKSNPRAAVWLDELKEMHEAELSGTQTALMRVTNLIDSAAGTSLGAGPDAARFEDVLQGRTTLLVSLDSRRYPALARVLAGWCLVAMQRACASVPPKTRALMVVDEAGAFGRHARHLEPLLARAREADVGVVVAAHGPTQLDAAMAGLSSQLLQECAWNIILAQGDPDDADRLSRLFPLDVGKPISLGRVASGVPTVTRDHLMWLATGDCAYRVRAVDGLHGRWGRARIALPRRLAGVVELPEEGATVGYSARTEEQVQDAEVTPGSSVAAITGDQDQAAVYRNVRVVDGWRRWRGNFDKDGYPRIWSTSRRRHLPVHRLVCRWEYPGGIPRGWEVDHTCNELDCLDHLEPVTKAENLRRRHARARGELPTGHAGLVPPERVAALLELSVLWGASALDSHSSNGACTSKHVGDPTCRCSS